MGYEGFSGNSADKESTCNAGDPSSSPELGRSPGEGIGYSLQYSWVSSGGSDGKESACNVGDLGSIPIQLLLICRVEVKFSNNVLTE